MAKPAAARHARAEALCRRQCSSAISSTRSRRSRRLLDAILRTGAHAHLVQVVDPIEETFPYAGRTEFHDPETGLRHVVSRAEQYRGDYQNRLAALRDRLTTLCRRLDWTFIVHRTDRPATEPLLALHARLADRHSRASGAAFAGRAA